MSKFRVGDLVRWGEFVGKITTAYPLTEQQYEVTSGIKKMYFSESELELVKEEPKMNLQSTSIPNTPPKMKECPRAIQLIEDYCKREEMTPWKKEWWIKYTKAIVDGVYKSDATD